MEDHRFDNEELLTARLSLRRPTPDDIGLIFAINSDPRTCLHNPSDALGCREDAEELFERWNEHWQRFGFGYWVVHCRVSGARFGFCGIKFTRLRERMVLNLFYRLDPDVWGSGLASEAATAVVTWATGNLPEHPVIARVRPENLASQRVAARAGLVRAEHLDGPGFDGLDWIFTAN